MLCKPTALETLLDTLTQEETKVLDSLEEIDVVGHRVVHGGAKYSQPVLIDKDVKKAIAAMVVSLNGLDVLVFTAGAGENQNMLRENICESLSYLGLQLDLAKNNADPVDLNIASDNSQVEILVIHTQEDWAIAIAASQVISKKAIASTAHK